MLDRLNGLTILSIQSGILELLDYKKLIFQKVRRLI